MFKEWAQKRFDEAILRSRQFGLHRGLKPEGKTHLDQLIKDYKEGKEIFLSKYIHMLDGFDYKSNIHGLENLEKIKNEPILIVANHPYEDPLKGGHCQRILINHNVYNITQKEVRWLFGEDKTSPEHLIRKRFARQSNTILVRDDNPKGSRTSIRQAFRNKDAIGLNSEGDGNKTLHRGVAKAGEMIIFSVLHNYNIVCVATDFKNDAFFLALEPPLDNERIKKAAKRSKPDKNMSRADKEKNRQKLRQMISNYAMARIAQHLPPEKRGYYSNFQEFIDAFESLTA